MACAADESVMDKGRRERAQREECGGLAEWRGDDHCPPRSEGWGGEPSREVIVAPPRAIVAASES